MMDMYNNNFNENNENYYSELRSRKPEKNTKKRFATKAAAGIMAMALVSAGSIGTYKALSGSNYDSSTTLSAYTDVFTGEEASTLLKADTISHLTNTSEAGAVLSNEDIVEKMLPSVVGIKSEFNIASSGYNGNFGFGFSNKQSSSDTVPATGTGFIISEDGYIVTNAHVIYDSEYGSGLSESISVILNDESEYDAEVVGYDTDFDLAVLKINAECLTAAEFGNSDALKLGESVIAIGNPLGFDLMNTVTSGIVSGKDRNVTINEKSMTLLQTDAAINSGNSGGPLINKYGQVIGINSSMMSSSYSQTTIEGIGFAIPSNEASKIVKDLIEYGYVTGKPQLGISCEDVTSNISRMYNLPVGVYVTSVNKGSSADKAGLRTGDIITAVDGKEIQTTSELLTEKKLHSAGDEISVTFTRNGSSQTVLLTLDEATGSN